MLLAQTDVEEAEDEYACQKCGKADHPEWILLCDSCDKGWHCSCLRPALMLIPEGDWFCPPCQHVSLSYFENCLYIKHINIICISIFFIQFYMYLYEIIF